MLAEGERLVLHTLCDAMITRRQRNWAGGNEHIFEQGQITYTHLAAYHRLELKPEFALEPLELAWRCHTSIVRE